MPESAPEFCQFEYVGSDAEKFLQGQVTVNISRLHSQYYQATAICDLKGRIHFGLWLRRHSSEQIDIVIAKNLAEDLAQHIKKYGAFSKSVLRNTAPIYPTIINDYSSFTSHANQAVASVDWQTNAILHGQAWINQDTAHQFQPQELRLHQRGGVDYDKGCYLGQEIIARLWFKAKPKHWLHLVEGHGIRPIVGEKLADDVQVVNSIDHHTGWLALVCAKPDALSLLTLNVLELPAHLNGEVARPK